MKYLVSAGILFCSFTASAAEPAKHSAVMEHYLCTAEAAYEPIARAAGKGRGHVVYEEAQKCLDEKLSAALAEAGKYPDLKAATKSWHAKAMTLMHSPDDKVIERDESEASSVLEMEGKLAGLWH